MNAMSRDEMRCLIDGVRERRLAEIDLPKYRSTRLSFDGTLSLMERRMLEQGLCNGRPEFFYTQAPEGKK